MSGGSLPRTGAAITIGAVTMTIPQFVTVGAILTAVGLVLVGASVIRFRFRRSQSIDS